MPPRAARHGHYFYRHRTTWTTTTTTDCDDCLYFNDWSTANALTASIEGYCVEELGLSPGTPYKLYKEHGTCLKGLQVEGIIDDESVDTFLQKVHDIELDIEPDPRLREMILQVTGDNPR